MSSARSRVWLALVAAPLGAEEIRLDGWTAVVDAATLTIRMRAGGEEAVVAQGVRPPGVAVKFSALGRRLRIRIESDREQTIDWPRTSGDAALILPEGEGLYVPVENGAWRKRVAGRCYEAHGQLSLPIWAWQSGRRTVTYHVPSDIRTELCVEEQPGGLAAVARHRFRDRDGRPAYEVEIWPSGPSPVAPAMEYREGLKRVTLTEKIRANPEVGKLAGAIHMYVWGDGRTPEFVAELQRAGVRRAWIGYDGATQPPAAFLAAAKTAGYLVGPYDTYNNAQDPVKGEDYASRWPGRLFPEGCVGNADGKARTGFAGRGCELSSEALERMGRRPIAERLDAQLRGKPNSYFLDVDAYGELHDDFSPAHPMTKHGDRENRLRRLRDARARGVVLGSEHGAAWAVPVIDFGHGSLSVQNSVLWKKKKELGGWWPPARPRIFFQAVEPGEEFAAAKYDAAYRVPLYEAAFHDAVVSTDRWDVPMAKFPGLVKRRLLLELLYGSPSIWAMDRRALKEALPVLAKLLPVFEPLHREIATLPLTAFAWLTPDRQRQRTVFGGKVAVTVDFGAGCAEVSGLAEGLMRYCP